jgi:hypothetical protein
MERPSAPFSLTVSRSNFQEKSDYRFPKKYKFQLEVLKKNVRRIETSIMKVLDQEMRVEFVLVQNEKASFNKTEETHPVTQRMLELFGGEILD